MKTKYLFLIASLIGLSACSKMVHSNAYFLHNTTGHSITIVNTNSNVYSIHNSYDSVFVNNGDFYPLYYQTVSKEEEKYYDILNLQSRLYIYSNDTCFYIHQGDSNEYPLNCLWKYFYREPSSEELVECSAMIAMDIDNVFVYDLTDENIRSVVHRP